MRSQLRVFPAIAVLALALPAQTIVSSFLVGPAGVAFLGGLEFDCNSGIVWTVDETNNLIQAHDSAGRFLRSYPAPIPPGSTVVDPQPIGVGINSGTGRLWIGDEAEFVYEFDPLTGTTTGVSWSTLPAIIDLSGVAVDPITGDIYVSQDSGTPRKVAAFSAAGVNLNIINIPATGSVDPDGLAYNALSGTFYLGDDTQDRVYEIDATGATVNQWNLATLGISPEGLGVDLANGILYIGDGFVTRRVYLVSGIITPGGPCVPGPSLFSISVTTAGGGAGDATVVVGNVPPGTTEGWTFFTLSTATPVGGGPVFGVTPDANTFAIFTLAPVAVPGFVLHWTWPVAGLFPAVPFALPPGSLSPFAGTSWDFLGLAVQPTGFVPTFNVSRASW